MCGLHLIVQIELGRLVVLDLCALVIGVDQDHRVRQAHGHLRHFHALHTADLLRHGAGLLQVAESLRVRMENKVCCQRIACMSLRRIELTSSPNVGDAPQAISESSAEMMMDVFEQPMLVMCQPVHKIMNT